MKNEVWKTIPLPELKEYYQASDKGRIRSVDRVIKQKNLVKRKCKGKILKLMTDKDGYRVISLMGRLLKVHRLVLITFQRHPKPGEGCNHISGIKTDNNPKNLEWATTKENDQHARKNGLKKSYGEYNPKHKLKNHEVLDISRRLELGEREKDLANEFKVHRDTIHRIKIKKYWQRLLNNPGEVENYELGIRN
jgi:hypothetical protein